MSYAGVEYEGDDRRSANAVVDRRDSEFRASPGRMMGTDRRTIKHSLEEQAMLLGELEKSVAVLRDHLEPVLLRDSEKSPGMDSDDVPGGGSTIHDGIRGHNDSIQRLIRTVDRINREVDL